MALPSVGGGQQLNDGNLAEVIIGTSPTPATATSTATLTAAQITNGLIVADPSTSAATYTLPTVAQVEAVLTNAKVGSTFRFGIVNLGTSSGVITMSVSGSTGFTYVGLATIAISLQAGFLARKTGDGAWTVYRVS